MEPYYDEGGITIWHGDCDEVLPALGLFDLVFTSPPYNLGWATAASHHRIVRMAHQGSKWTGAALATGYADHGDCMPPPEYEAWQQNVLGQCWAHLSGQGAIFYNHKPRVSDKTLWTPLSLVPESIPLRQIIVWARAGGMNYGQAHYVPTHEWILVLAREAWKLRDQSASGVGDVWRVPQEPSAHPAPFPVALPARAIETTNPRSVLDPFAGSGTTLVAAKAAGVPAVGIELSERYCEMAAKRLAQGVLFGTSA